MWRKRPSSEGRGCFLCWQPNLVMGTGLKVYGISEGGWGLALCGRARVPEERLEEATGEYAALVAVKGPGLKRYEKKLRLGTMARSESLKRSVGEAVSESVALIYRTLALAFGDASTQGMATETAAALEGAGLCLGDKLSVLLVAGPGGGARHQALWRPEEPVGQALSSLFCWILILLWLAYACTPFLSSWSNKVFKFFF